MPNFRLRHNKMVTQEKNGKYGDDGNYVLGRPSDREVGSVDLLNLEIHSYFLRLRVFEAHIYSIRISYFS